MDGGHSPRRQLDLRSVSSPFSPISRYDDTDLNDLAPLVYATSPRFSESSSSSVKQRRRCSEILIASGSSPTQPTASGIPSFSTSHWLSALFQWIYVTFTDKKQQEYVLQEIVHCLNELGIIPLNISITSEQLLQIQQVIDSLRLRVWQEHNRANNNLPQYSSRNSNGGKNLLPVPQNGRRSPTIKHSLTFSGTSLAKFAALSTPKAVITPLPRLPLAALFPAGRYRNDFVEQEQLGRGGFGVVAKAVNYFDGTAYAVKKVYVKKKMINHDHLLRALQEVRAASLLNHPNIVRYYAAWIETVPEDEPTQVNSSDESIDDSSCQPSSTKDFSKMRSPERIQHVPSATSLSDEFDFNRQLNREFEKKNKKKPLLSVSNDNHNKPVSTIRGTTDDDGDIYFCDDSEPSGLNSSIKFQVNDSEDEDDSIIFEGSFGKKPSLPKAQESRLVPIERQRSKSYRRNASINEEFTRPPTPPSKVCLYIQMELCTLGTLADVLSLRNTRAASSGSSPLPSPLPVSPCYGIHHANEASGFDVGSPSSMSSSPIENLVNVSWNASVFLQIVRGLAFVHSRGVMHRDLKPHNIFLTGSSLACPEVKLGDFGLTRFDVFADQSTDIFRSTSLARVDIFRYSKNRHYSSEVGTRTYASPEQVKSLMYNRQSDMFSLGLILYELYRPFATTMERLANFDNLRKGGPDDLEISLRYPDTWHMIKRLTDETPSKRPNCTDLLAELETNEVDRLREVVEQQRREIERLRQVVDSPRFSSYSTS